VVELLRGFIKECESVAGQIGKGRGDLSPDSPLAGRVHELLQSWYTTIEPALRTAGISTTFLIDAGTELITLSQLTGQPQSKKSYANTFRRLQQVLSSQIQPQARALPAFVPSPAGPTSLIPEIPDLPNSLIPNSLIGWIPKMRQLLAQSAYGNNVFVMVSYSEELGPLIDKIKNTLIRLELNPIVARDKIITNNLDNPIACLLCCSYGVAIFHKSQKGQKHNPNVTYELGMTHLLKKPCVILKHKQLNKMPSDILAHLYEDYGTEKEACTKLKKWWKKQKES
jgi:hypothetical protein